MAALQHCTTRNLAARRALALIGEVTSRRLLRWLVVLDRVAVRILDLDLLAAGPASRGGGRQGRRASARVRVVDLESVGSTEQYLEVPGRA
jgi:hypothetical protein